MDMVNKPSIKNTPKNHISRWQCQWSLMYLSSAFARTEGPGHRQDNQRVPESMRHRNSGKQWPQLLQRQGLLQWGGHSQHHRSAHAARPTLGRFLGTVQFLDQRHISRPGVQFLDPSLISRSPGPMSR